MKLETMDAVQASQQTSFAPHEELIRNGADFDIFKPIWFYFNFIPRL